MRLPAIGDIYRTALMLYFLGVSSVTCEADQPLVLRGHTDAVYDVAFSPDGRMLASGSYDKTVILWDLNKKKPLATLARHTDQVFRVAFSPDGKSLASCSGDGTVVIWDLDSRNSRRVLAGHGDPIIDVVFSSDGRLVATAGSHIQLWQQDHQLWSTPHSQLFFTVAFSTDQESLACGTKDLIRIHGVADGECLANLAAGNGMIYQIEYSPDGTWLASACSDGMLSLWDADSYEKKRTATADNSALFATAFSPDGKYLVTGGRQRVVRIWTVPDLQLVGERYGPEETILSVSFSPDGKHIASGSYDGKIHFWSPDK